MEGVHLAVVLPPDLAESIRLRAWEERLSVSAWLRRAAEDRIAAEGRLLKAVPR